VVAINRNRLLVPDQPNEIVAAVINSSLRRSSQPQRSGSSSPTKKRASRDQC